VKGEGMSLKEGAQYLGLTEKALRGRIDRHLVPHRKVGRNILLWKSELEQWRQKLPGCDVATALENLQKRNGDD